MKDYEKIAKLWETLMFVAALCGTASANPGVNYVEFWEKNERACQNLRDLLNDIDPTIMDRLNAEVRAKALALKEKTS